MGKGVTLQRNDYFNDFVALLIFSSDQDDHAPVWATRSAVSSPEVIYIPFQRNLFTEKLSNISWLTLNLATTACAWAQIVDHIYWAQELMSKIFVILNIKTTWHQDIMTSRHHALSLSNCTNAPLLSAPVATSISTSRSERHRHFFIKIFHHYQYCI